MKEPTFHLIEECKDAKKIIVTGHIKPDGDCIGASIALTMYLRKRLPDAEIHLMLEKPAPCFAYLTGIELIETDYSGKPEDTDICIVVDTNSASEMHRSIMTWRRKPSISTITSATKTAART